MTVLICMMTVRLPMVLYRMEVKGIERNFRNLLNRKINRTRRRYKPRNAGV
jgi:hypothetical protein